MFLNYKNKLISEYKPDYKYLAIKKKNIQLITVEKYSFLYKFLKDLIMITEINISYVNPRIKFNDCIFYVFN